MKRLFDTLIASLLLCILFPILLIIGYKIKQSLGSPIMFRQQRPGLGGKPFEMMKFRSMKDALDENGQPLPDEQRLTPFGNRLRSMSLDELPTLWNVVKGDMSLVGPRPLLMEYLPLYDNKQSRRHEVKPGVTGWAQVNGRNAISWEDKFNLDVWYVDNQSFWLDIKILFLTVKKVLVKDGISQEGHVTMSKFQGAPSSND